MATPQERLADSLKELQKLQNKNGFAVIKSTDLSRTHLGRLVDNGFLKEVMKGWYISSRPDSVPGDTTNWYTSYWFFVSKYANVRFGDDWCLSADQSLAFYSGNRTVPKQVIIRTSKGTNNLVNLLHDTSILYFQASIPTRISIEPAFGLSIYSLPEALIECSPVFFRLDSVAALTCLSMVSDVGDILKIVLEKGQTKKAGRLAGAFRNIGHTSAADEIIRTMKGLGYDIREEDPFSDRSVLDYSRIASPYVIRLKLLWNKMREVVIANFPEMQHTHTNMEAVREAMPVFFELMKNEPDARVRAVLGHFFFVYIHPYMDGNGRIARFLMNVMLISGGYNWTIIPVEKRQEYMAALEKANVQEDISDFTLFLASLLKTESQ